MISTRKLVVAALGVSALMAACTSDPVIPPLPKAPPQLGMSVVYAHTDDNKGLNSNDVYALLVVSNGEFWIGTNAGVNRFPSTSSNVVAHVVNEVNGLPHPQVKAMAELDGKVYVATWGGGLGVYDIAGDAWTQVRPTGTGLTDGYVADLTVSPTEDKLYLATNDGAFIYAPATDTWTHFPTTDAPADEFDTIRMQSTISSVEVVDDAGIVQRWYGPRVEIRVDNPSDFGILVSKNTASDFRYTTENSGLVERNVNDIYYDPVRKTYWVAYVTKGISEVNVDAKTWTDYTLVQGLPSNTVYSITRASDGSAGGASTTLWAATQGGLAKLDGAGTHWQGYGRSAGLPADRARRVYSDDGKRLWVGFVDGGAAKIKL